MCKPSKPAKMLYNIKFICRPLLWLTAYSTEWNSILYIGVKINYVFSNF